MIGGRIKNYLEDKGIKQRFVADKAGLTVSAMSDICNEKRKVDAVEYYMICKALAVPLDFFLEGVEL